VRGRIEAILSYAKAAGWRKGENPAAWRDNLAMALPAPSKGKRAKRREQGKGEHHAAMAYGDLPAFMAQLRAQAGLSARCLEFVILTACRTGEAIGARWSEIDLEGRTWGIPAGRMKGAREHVVPLSGAATSVLAGLPRDAEFVFGGARPISNMAMAMLLRRMKHGALTVHGFRGTFSTWCAEMTNTPIEVREAALAHVSGDKVAAAYQRGDFLARRRDLAERWRASAGAPMRGRRSYPCGREGVAPRV
jgi:integrase